MAVGQVVIANSSDRDVQLQRVDIRTEDAVFHTTIQNALNHLVEPLATSRKLGRVGYMLGAMQVGAVDQGDELWIVEIVLPGEFDEFFQRIAPSI